MGGDSGAQAVHVVQNAEGSGDADTHTTVKVMSSKSPLRPPVAVLKT